jgi:hypothetical protein
MMRHLLFLVILGVSMTFAIRLAEAPPAFSIKDILSNMGGYSEMKQEEFDKIFIRPEINHMFLSDVDRVLDSLAKDFSDVVKVSSIGQSV